MSVRRIEIKKEERKKSHSEMLCFEKFPDKMHQPGQ